jgi:hypothetical protein
MTYGYLPNCKGQIGLKVFMSLLLFEFIVDLKNGEPCLGELPVEIKKAAEYHGQ